LNCDDWRAEARRRARHTILIERMKMKLAAAKAREQRDADEEGCGAVLCAIRAARRQMLKEAVHGDH